MIFGCRFERGTLNKIGSASYCDDWSFLMRLVLRVAPAPRPQDRRKRSVPDYKGQGRFQTDWLAL
jgi:hypothetical protein